MKPADRRPADPRRPASADRGHPPLDAASEAILDAIAARGLKFMPGPPDAYYALSHERVIGHSEPVERMKKHGILIDGEGVVDGGETRILLQIFSKTVIGPIFFEFIERKGDDGFGEGNFKALFESIEQEQIDTGEIVAK